MDEIILEARNIKKKFRQGDREIEVLKGVDFKVKRNSVNSIIGVSGAGKSTLLHIMGALEKPTSGNIVFDGMEIQNMNNDELAGFRNKKIGLVFQFFNLLPEFNALENVMLPAMISRESGSRSQASRDKAAALLEEVGLKDRMNHRPADLSGGEQQRVAIARALVNDPVLLLADEPTGNLDRETAMAVYGIMIEMSRSKNTSFVVVTHDEELVRQSDYLFHLKDGKLL